MREIIVKHLKKDNRKTPLIVEMVKGVVLSRSVSSTKCANYICGPAKKASKIKRIERFYKGDYMANEDATGFMLGITKTLIKCSLDRTNWKYGDQDINALALYGKAGDIAGLLNVEMLDNKGGSSDFADRKRVLDPVLERAADRIEVLLGDREFFSLEFVSYLIEKGIPFVIRIKRNLKFARPFVQTLKHTSRIQKNVFVGRFNGKEIYLDISGKKIKDDYVIVVSKGVHNPLKEYRRRFDIETFFKALKTAGFNIESTHIKKLNRLRALFLLCGIAYLLCVMMGLIAHNAVARIKFKRTLGYNQFSLFRYGIDWFTEIIFSGCYLTQNLCLPSAYQIRVR